MSTITRNDQRLAALVGATLRRMPNGEIRARMCDSVLSDLTGNGDTARDALIRLSDDLLGRSRYIDGRIGSATHQAIRALHASIGYLATAVDASFDAGPDVMRSICAARLAVEAIARDLRSRYPDDV